LEKAIEIKRRAQRCVQNGDVDGALREYEKLVDSPDTDPYNYVLLADLLHKKGDHARAGERYLNAVSAYELAGLFKNGIAVCKKMLRLSLSQGEVLRHLATLHARDGLTSEASGYFSQYAEYALRASRTAEAITALRSAFDHGQENVKLLERLSEVLLLEGHNQKAAEAMLEAAQYWQARNQMADMRRCIARADVIQPGISGTAAVPEGHVGPPPLPGHAVLHPGQPAAEPAPGASTPPAAASDLGILSGSRMPETASAMFEPPTVTTPTESVPEAAPAPTPSSVMARAVAKAAEDAAAQAASLANSRPAPDPANAAHPRMDSSVFERAPMFVAPPGVAPPGVAPPAMAAPTAPPQAPVLATPSLTPPPVAPPTLDAGHEPLTPAEGVYNLAIEDHTSYETALREASLAEPAKPTAFEPEPLPDDPTPSVIARRPEELLGSIQNVEELLLRAQTEFRAGHRDRASQALVEAALAYERLDRLDSAATIFRSLGRGPQAPIGVMELWLANCERRNDPIEGSQVACELGDRALNDGHDADARRWFERSLALYAQNDIARRRLQRLANSVAAQAAPTAEAPPPEQGRVAVAVGRGQAVTFDLSSLLQEFQRGVTSQLEGDAQGHYDLGMAYREMGLYDEAVGSFRIAERDIRLAFRAQEMIGRCLADSGRNDDAVKEFEDALRSPTLDAAGEAELRLQLALSLAALGHTPDALAQLEIADMRFPGRPDVAERLAEWRRAFGQAA
jgi:tetratricopeptide (TPR) repeat protein